MPLGRVELPKPFEQQSLRLPCLPIPPQGQMFSTGSILSALPAELPIAAFYAGLSGWARTTDHSLTRRNCFCCKDPNIRRGIQDSNLQNLFAVVILITGCLSYPWTEHPPFCSVTTYCFLTKVSRWQDLNLRDPTRPPGSRPGALTKLSYTEVVLAPRTRIELA